MTKTKTKTYPYLIVCERGTWALVSASSAEDAEYAWDADAIAGRAEPRASGARRATRREVNWCVRTGHDYR